MDDARFPRPPILRPDAPVKLSLADRWSIALQSSRLMAAVFSIVAAVGIVLVFLLVTPRYQAILQLSAPQSASVFYGQTSSARDQLPILQSELLAKHVVGQLGARRMFPNLDARGERGRIAALSAFRRALDARLSRTGDAVELRFRSHDARIAALALDRLISAYAAYQRETGGLVDDAPLMAQRRALDERMALADDAMRAFLSAHKVSDYRAELDSAAALADALAHDVAVGKAELAEIEARLQSAQSAADRLGLTADLTARTKKVAALQREMTAATQRANRLRVLSPEYERLRFARDTVLAAAAQLSAKDEDVRAGDSVRLAGVAAFRPASAPLVTRIERYRLPLAIGGALMLASMSAVAVGLARSLRKGVLPTPAAAERHLGLPVLVVVPRAAR
ncbi:MAG: hypothetical protein ABWZ40_09610 [Caulobacterales bacterium]